MNRLEYFLSRKDHWRFYWFQNHSYLPPVYAGLSDDEFQLFTEWFEDTERLNWIGECNIPVISSLLGVIEGNGIDSIVQLGHYAGYSTLLIGWALRRMGKKNALFTIDINPCFTEYLDNWIKRADLQDQVKTLVSNSSDASVTQAAKDYLGKDVKLLFIDSSHQYEHTLSELKLWYPELPSSGLIAMHDISEDARRYDSTAQGGVLRAIDEWSLGTQVPVFRLAQPVFQDTCGLGWIVCGDA